MLLVRCIEEYFEFKKFHFHGSVLGEIIGQFLNIMVCERMCPGIVGSHGRENSQT